MSPYQRRHGNRQIDLISKTPTVATAIANLARSQFQNELMRKAREAADQIPDALSRWWYHQGPIKHDISDGDISETTSDMSDDYNDWFTRDEKPPSPTILDLSKKVPSDPDIFSMEPLGTVQC